MFCVWTHSYVASAAALGGAEAAAHTALFAIAMTCFTFGDVGSSTSQAFLPAFITKEKDSDGTEKEIFALDEARPTIKAILRTTATVSMGVCMLAAGMITFGAASISPDAEVIRLMKNTMPLILFTLTTHGTAVTLEGLLLAQRKFKALNFIYTAVASTIIGLFAYVRRLKVGLLGVWGVYVWFQISRVGLFIFASGLPRRSKILNEENV